MKSAPLTSCQQAAEAFRVAMHNIGALEDVASSLPTDDPEEEEEIQEGLAQWPDRASEEDYNRDLGMREWREGGDWRLVDGADGNYNSGLEQPESEPEEQIHNHPQSELDEELELDESEGDDPMFVGAVAAKMVRGELQLLIRWEAGDHHSRHPKLHCLV